MKLDLYNTAAELADTVVKKYKGNVKLNKAKLKQFGDTEKYFIKIVETGLIYNVEVCVDEERMSVDVIISLDTLDIRGEIKDCFCEILKVCDKMEAWHSIKESNIGRISFKFDEILQMVK